MNSLFEKAKAINGEYRTAAMNRRYYACRLQSAQAWSRWLDILVAVTSSGTVAAWNAWQIGAGAFVWKGLAATAAVVAVVKPLLRLTRDIERYSELVVGYATTYYDMKQLVEDVRTTGTLTDQAWQTYCDIRRRTKELGIKDDLKPRKRLHRRCFEEIKREIPPTALWWPAENTHDERATTHSARAAET